MPNTYWIKFPRGFDNEFTVAVATDKDHAERYAAEGYERIPRATALRQLRYRGDAATEAYASAEYDRHSVDRWELVEAIITGTPIAASAFYA
jgi:hypothetical protein